MIRAKRRQPEPEPVPIDARTALESERTGRWPERDTRRNWWSQRSVPAHLRPAAEPDPRRVLAGEMERLMFENERDALQSARLAWLEEVANG